MYQHKDHEDQFEAILAKCFFLICHFTVPGMMEKLSLSTLNSSFCLTSVSIALEQINANATHTHTGTYPRFMPSLVESWGERRRNKICNILFKHVLI